MERYVKHFVNEIYSLDDYLLMDDEVDFLLERIDDCYSSGYITELEKNYILNVFKVEYDKKIAEYEKNRDEYLVTSDDWDGKW